MHSHNVYYSMIAVVHCFSSTFISFFYWLYCLELMFIDYSQYILNVFCLHCCFSVIFFKYTDQKPLKSQQQSYRQQPNIGVCLYKFSWCFSIYYFHYIKLSERFVLSLFLFLFLYDCCFVFCFFLSISMISIALQFSQ